MPLPSGPWPVGARDHHAGAVAGAAAVVLVDAPRVRPDGVGLLGAAAGGLVAAGVDEDEVVEVAVGLVEVRAGDAPRVLLVVLRPVEAGVVGGELQDGVAGDPPDGAGEVVGGVPRVAVGAVVGLGQVERDPVLDVALHRVGAVRLLEVVVAHRVVAGAAQRGDVRHLGARGRLALGGVEAGAVDRIRVAEEHLLVVHGAEVARPEGGVVVGRRRRDAAVQRAVEVVAGGVSVGPRRGAELDEQHQGVGGVGAGGLAGDHAGGEVVAQRLAL